MATERANMKEPAPTVESVWCENCEGIKPVLYSHMDADELNNHAGTDIQCAECYFVIATLHHPVASPSGETPALDQSPWPTQGKECEAAVQKLKGWCDCGGEGCDLCRIAKLIVKLHMRSVAAPQTGGWIATATGKLPQTNATVWFVANKEVLLGLRRPCGDWLDTKNGVLYDLVSHWKYVQVPSPPGKEPCPTCKSTERTVRNLVTECLDEHGMQDEVPCGDKWHIPGKEGQ